MAKREDKTGTNKPRVGSSGNREDVNRKIQEHYQGAHIVEEEDVASGRPTSFAKPDAVGKDASLLRKKLQPPGAAAAEEDSATTADDQDDVRFKKVTGQPGADPGGPQEKTLVTKKNRVIGSQG